MPKIICSICGKKMISVKKEGGELSHAYIECKKCLKHEKAFHLEDNRGISIERKIHLSDEENKKMQNWMKVFSPHIVFKGGMIERAFVSMFKEKIVTASIKSENMKKIDITDSESPIGFEATKGLMIDLFVEATASIAYPFVAEYVNDILRDWRSDGCKDEKK